MSAADFLPSRRTLPSLASAAERCQGCELFKNATQTVFGAGAATARMVLIGEAPGDREDLEGAPFVGPAGRLLDELLAAAGIARDDVYVTNAVKHFKWEPRGKRRLHKKPSARELKACRPWLEAELAVIGPEAVVCLGATAAQAIFGRTFRITTQRGEILSSDWSLRTLATWHPSAILRAPDDATRRSMQREARDDLARIARAIVAESDR